MEPAQEAPPTCKKIGIVSIKYKGQRTRDEGAEDRKQRSKGQEQWNRATKRGTQGQLIGVRGWRKDGRQGAEP